MRRLPLRTSSGNGLLAALAVLVFYAVVTPLWIAAKGWRGGGLSLALVAAGLQAHGRGFVVMFAVETIRFVRGASRARA